MVQIDEMSSDLSNFTTAMVNVLHSCITSHAVFQLFLIFTVSVANEEGDEINGKAVVWWQ